MRKCVFLLAVLFSGSVMADTSDSTPGFRYSGGYSGGTIYSAPAACKGVYEGCDWNRDGTYAAHPGVTTPAKELAEQIKRNEAARGQYDDYGNAPYEYSASFVRAFQQGGSN